MAWSIASFGVRELATLADGASMGTRYGGSSRPHIGNLYLDAHPSPIGGTPGELSDPALSPEHAR
ncbi:hypothetical protein GCM10009743_68550 [Kribbella swartbergensis]